MSWVAAAVVGSAVVGGVASYSAGKTQAKAAGKASDATLEATRETNALKKEMFDIQRADQEPWMRAGTQALQHIQETPDFDFGKEQFFTDPSYEWRINEGINALDRSAASRGRILSGAQDRAVTRYGQGVASQEYQNAFNRAKTTYDTNLNTQKSLAGVGQQATNIVGQAGSNMANSVGNTLMQGTAQSNNFLTAGATAKANSYTGMANQATGAIGNYLLYQNQKGTV